MAGMEGGREREVNNVRSVCECVCVCVLWVIIDNPMFTVDEIGSHRRALS